jgi:hypothetical protein
MGYPVTLRLDCQFCGAKHEQQVDDGAAFKAVSAAWMQTHRPCAKGQDVRLTSTGVKDDGTEEPILTAVFKGETHG